MARSTRHSLVSWLCLLCVWLGSSGIPGALVLCRHADGGSEIEWGPCGVDEQGRCVSGCPDSDEDEAPGPCEDKPLKDDRHFARLSPRQQVDQAIMAPEVVVGACWQWMDQPLRSAGLRAVDIRGWPPDVVGRLRTVILLV